ncbi:ATP-binding protein [Comamonas sp. 26]|uniref:ATP-binding protein n=1 Tax=Comamonas sp. 26 TaxID=2035201 RepID=UPI000C17CEA4|nr:AAA family ATPase [Comamonas sp. 26]PIG09541.1 magnesium chelatase subunit I [Comamonas sp. 26]
MSAAPKNEMPCFPFTAIEGQPQLQLALLLLAVDPLLGGVLVEGPRGTAKSTAARALADLLPAGRFVNLPLGTTEEQLQGSLDLQAVLKHSEVQFRPGLLAQAHQGLLYVDEVNLLPDGLVDLLLDVSASGINRVERDGVSHQHAARMALVGTMNPEEGQLRPQLLDRFGLFVRLANVPDAQARKRIVRTRMAFDADPTLFVARHADAQAQLAANVVQARARLDVVSWPESVFDQVADLCQQAQVEGVRADLVMLRAARAHAALQGRAEVAGSDVTKVAELALAHRRHPQVHPPVPPAEKPQSQPEDSQAQSQPEPPAASVDAAQGSGGAANSDGWGGMAAPQQVGIQSIKELRPLHTKKA